MSTTINPPLRTEMNDARPRPSPPGRHATHWTTLDTILTLATTIAVTAALIGAVAAGWGLAL